MPLYNKGTFDDRFYKVFNKKVTWIFLTTAYKKEAWLLSNFLSYWYEIVVLFYLLLPYVIIYGIDKFSAFIHKRKENAVLQEDVKK